MKNYLKFWGTRGSCSVSGVEYREFGGNTCCLQIVYEGTQILIDAGTGIRHLSTEFTEKSTQKIHLFIGHTHWDHISGFPFFDPIYHAGNQITIWSPFNPSKSCRDIFAELFSSEFFPVQLDEVQAKLDFRTIHPKTPVTIGPLTIDFHASNHPGISFCFKIKTPFQTIGYITDNEVLRGYQGEIAEIDPTLFEPHQSFIDFFKGCDLLVHEAQYFPEEYLQKVGWGHSSARNAVALIQKIQPARWLVTHHDPKHSDTDLKLLCEMVRKMLQQEKIGCPVDWLADETQIPLK